MNKDPDNDILLDVFMHIGQQRHSRIKGYYVCICGTQCIYSRPIKQRVCPVCKGILHLVSKIDEFEEARIYAWSKGNVIVEERRKAV